MITEIGSQVRITDPSPEIRDWCNTNLKLPNPEYAKKARMGLWLGKTLKELVLYTIEGDTLVIPFGCLRDILPLLSGEVTTTFTHPEPVHYQAKVPLYDYQRQAVLAMRKAQYGILQAPAGCGKTQMGIALAYALSVKTLWLTHTKDLLTQSKDRAAQYINPDLLGTITEGQIHIGKTITFATIQTMCRIDLAQYRDTWDCIIVDECHRVSGTLTAVTQFSKVLNTLRARHKYGLSATAHRSDGLIAATYSLLGKVVRTVPDEDVADKIMTVNIQPRFTGMQPSTAYLNTDGTTNYAKLINYITQNPMHNQAICADLLQNQDHSNLILSARIDHLKLLISKLPMELQQQAAIITGAMTSKRAKVQREQAIEDMRTGKLRYLFATYALAKEGLDIPRLDRLYLTTPQKDYAVIVQSIGRIARTFAGKQQPIAYDYVDNIRSLENAFKQRCTHYRKCGCKLIE